jgi:predicted DNA-binding protein (MmcQ/YjbR family)
MDEKKEIEELIKRQFKVVGDYPFEDDLEDEIFRHPENGKWFALLIKVSNARFSLEPANGSSYLLTLKGNPLQIPFELDEDHFHPAYHMNKKHWMSILLNETTPKEKTLRLLKTSYALTSPKKKRRPKADF